jgi:lipopolysaccharide cholinephosphotransferase
MANYDIRPLQMRMLRVLKALDETCKAHDLRYGIFAGSLIGAVRHKGFIPWDDDMDVLMPRPDYERFIEHSRDWLPEPYEFVCAENDPEYPLPFGKIQDASTTLIERRHLSYLGGIYVDVFPLDAVPKNIIARRLHFSRYEMMKQALMITISASW